MVLEAGLESKNSSPIGSLFPRPVFVVLDLDAQISALAAMPPLPVVGMDSYPPGNCQPK